MRPVCLIVVAALLVGSLPPAVAFTAQPEPAPAPSPGGGPRLKPADLDRSLALGRQYLLNSVRANGSIVYEFDAERGEELPSRFAVREMGGLWALAFFHRQDPTPETAKAVVKALKLQSTFAKRTPGGGMYLCEPKMPVVPANLMALYALSLQDFLAADFELAPAARAAYEKDLAGAVKFLLSLRMPNGRFYPTYRCRDGRGTGTPSPYADGEALLALVRAAKESGDESLRAVVLESAAAMYGVYVRSALQIDPDSEDTKGFYQWGSMAFYELYTSGWPGTQAYAGRTIAMARWMIDVHQVLDRSRNTGYAFEGLAVAWELARLTKDLKNQRYIADAIDKGLSKLMTWQVGSPLAGDAVPRTFAQWEKAKGGIVSEAGDPRLRVDTVQHQMHATMMVRWLLFRPEEAADGR